MKYIAGIDLGGTNIKSIIVDTDFRVVAQKTTPTPSEKQQEVLFFDPHQPDRRPAS